MIEEIKQIRSKSAIFYKADFHLHSPLSPCWKNNTTDTYEAVGRFNRISKVDGITEDILEAYGEMLLNKKVNVVAITDHMRYSFGLKLAEYVHMRKLNIVVFPGIELNIKVKQPLIDNFRFHVLAIFPTDIGDKIERIFPSDIKGESERTGKEEIECNRIEEIIEPIRGVGGICIAAHIYNKPNGVRYAYTKSAELILEPLEKVEPKEKEEFYKKVGDSIKDKLFNFDGLQVKASTEPIHFFDDNGELSVPLILSSDAHHIDNIGVESKLSFIKLGRLDFEGLKEAFKFPDTRIRFKANLPECHPPRILGVRIIGKQENKCAFFKKLIVGFSDNLTCIIGPRGSGKSALIDAIRYAMGYNRTLDEIEKVKDQVIDRQCNTLEESKIGLFYQRKDRTIHRVESTFDSRETYNTKLFDLDDNELNISDVEKCGDYPLNLYGWNELELLGENPKSQRENLDKFIKELRPLKESKNEFYRKLEENRKSCAEQLEILEGYFNISPGQYSFIRLKEYEKEFQKLNTPEIEEKFKNLDEIAQKSNFLKQIKISLENTIDSVLGVVEIEYEEILEKYKSIVSWCNDFIEKRLDLKDINDSLLKTRGSLKGTLNSLKDIIEKEESLLLESKNEAFKTIRAAVGDEEAISVDLRNSAKERLERAKSQFEAYKRDLEKLESLLLQREEMIKEIKDVNKKIFATRHEEISKIEKEVSIVNDQEFTISLKLNQSCDKFDFLISLEENRYSLDFHGHWKSKKIPNVISSKFDPILFVETILGKDSNELVHNIRIEDNNIPVEYNIDQEYAQKFIEDNSPFDELVDLQVKMYDKDKLLRLLLIQETLFDDEFYIELGGKPIQRCSPGQRCSAMLPIVTLTSDAPIIIDQPEDNLDNRLVSRAIFKILAKLKETRQIIVATHNPNILVSGDAEQVIVLNHDGTVKDYGSIDEPSIIQNIIDLMEGGKEAFEKRQKKYVDYL